MAFGDKFYEAFWAWYNDFYGLNPVRPVSSVAPNRVAAISAPQAVNVRPVASKPGTFTKPPLFLAPAATQIPHRLVYPKGDTIGPPGWLGWLMHYGGLCFAFEAAWMDHPHNKPGLSPRLRLKWHSTGVGYAELQTKEDGLLVRHFAEMPCPTWGLGFGPEICAEGVTIGDLECTPGWSYTIDKMLEDRINVVSEKGSYPQGDEYNFRVNSDLIEKETHDWHRTWYKKFYGSKVVPAENVIASNVYWRTHGKNTLHGRTLNAADELLLGRALSNDNYVRPVGWWDKDEARRKTWAGRIVRWFDTCQWAVNALEKARVNTRDPLYCPKWWVQYANSWGIAVSEPHHTSERETYSQYHRDDVPSGDFGLSGGDAHADNLNSIAKALRLDMSGERWERVAKVLLQVAPTPGTKGFLGEQIAPPGSTRHIMDMPRDCGSLRPPIYVEGLYAHYIQRACANEGSFKEAAVTVVKWINSIIGIVGSMAGGSAVSSCMSAMNTAYAAVGSLLQCVAGMAKGGSFDAGDALDLVGRIVSCTSAVAAVADVDVSDMIPDGVWEAVSTAGAVIPAWGGSLKEIVQVEAKKLQNELQQLKDLDLWPYLEEGFSSIIPGRLLQN